MSTTVEEITEIINRETTAWDTGDVDLLLSIFHSDMVWIWPKDNTSHNPIDWELPLGKFNYDRWTKVYTKLFNENKILKNDRKIIDIKISKEGDGAFAVVDVNTVWVDGTGNETNWLGLAGKTYSKVNGEWKMVAHYGLLKY